MLRAYAPFRLTRGLAWTCSHHHNHHNHFNPPPTALIGERVMILMKLMTMMWHGMARILIADGYGRADARFHVPWCAIPKCWQVLTLVCG